MSENVNIDFMNSRQGAVSNSVQEPGPTNLEFATMLDQVFDLIFNSSKQVLGNIMSIGIKYGENSKNPDNMLVVFPTDVFGFQAWNGTQKKRWRYERRSKTITKNGQPIQKRDQQSFVLFVQQGIDALNDQKVTFSKNITAQELKNLK